MSIDVRGGLNSAHPAQLRPSGRRCAVCGSVRRASWHSACTDRALSGVRTAGALHVAHHITHSIVHGVIQQAWIVGGICLAAIALQVAAMLPTKLLSRGTSSWGHDLRPSTC
ncbi:hypothetical protein ASF90_08495 [Xanthomonas sp. Leaf148]|nr:hypothetical protein ASF90_08495 [Xanthomonas sp. Leaf148]